MLSVKNIIYQIANIRFLNGIHIDFEPGRFHVILGPNGSGKSTFLKIFSGELQPQSGIVQYDGDALLQSDKVTLARRRAVMSQLPELHFPLTVNEVVMMGRYPHFKHKPSAKDETICKEAMDKMEITRFSDRNYLTLSGGEKQRVQFARALAQIWEAPATGNRYLFLDEPISSLDIHYQHQILQLAKTLTKEDIVLIAVLHDINLAIQYADNMLFMKQGRVVAKGKPAEIVTAGLMQSVFNIPVAIIKDPYHVNPIVMYNNQASA